jgi:hypothetical protein
MSAPETKLLDPNIAGNGVRDGDSGSSEYRAWLDEPAPENDVRYGIADCRRRVRTQRTTLRTHHFPTETPTGETSAISSYAEILATVSMNQSSLSRLVECLLDSGVSRNEVSEEREEAALT